MNLKAKIEWMLEGNFLTDNDDKQEFAYGINLRTKKFYSIYKWQAGAKRPHILISDVVLPLEDIAKNMVVFKVSK